MEQDWAGFMVDVPSEEDGSYDPRPHGSGDVAEIITRSATEMGKKGWTTEAIARDRVVLRKGLLTACLSHPGCGQGYELTINPDGSGRFVEITTVILPAGAMPYQICNAIQSLSQCYGYECPTEVGDDSDFDLNSLEDDDVLIAEGTSLAASGITDKSILVSIRNELFKLREEVITDYGLKVAEVIKKRFDDVDASRIRRLIGKIIQQVFPRS